jgi:hypothetical protein
MKRERSYRAIINATDTVDGLDKTFSDYKQCLTEISSIVGSCLFVRDEDGERIAVVKNGQGVGSIWVHLV